MKLTAGLWGVIAAGGLFEQMTVVAGRQRPHAAERKREVITYLRPPSSSLGTDRLRRGSSVDAGEQFVHDRAQGLGGVDHHRAESAVVVLGGLLPAQDVLQLVGIFTA